jgi:hypothetical protein
MAAQPDLWGEIPVDDVRTPVTILREQAALLGPKTKNIIEARVSTLARDGHFYHSFDLIVPALDNYIYELFRVDHDVTLYPIYTPNDEKSTFRGSKISLKTEEEFTDWLRHRLSSHETRKIISSLLAQATN